MKFNHKDISHEYRDDRLVLVLPVNTKVDINYFIDVFLENNAQGIVLSSTAMSFRNINNLNFLDKVKGNLIEASIDFKRLDDCSFITQLENLRILRVAGLPNHVIKLNGLNYLKKYSGEYDSQHIQGVEYLDNIEEVDIECKNSKKLEFNGRSLQKLKLWSYNKPDLSELESYKELKSLELTQAKTYSLKGIQYLSKLEYLLLAHNRKLRDVKDIVGSNVTEVEVETCKKIESLESFGLCKNLVNLILFNTGIIRNLSPFVQSKSLRRFAFIDTLVEDGDLSILEQRDWDYINFSNKRHYNRKSSDFPASRGI